MGRPEGRDRARRFPDWLVGIFTLEAIAVGIAVFLPLTPSKTGSTWSPAELFKADPAYFEKVLASFVTVNLLIGLLGVVAWVVARLGGPK